MNDLLHIRLEKGIKQQIASISKDFHFSNASEFVKDAIRKNLEEYEKRRAITALSQLHGSVLTAKKLSKKERAVLVEQYLDSGRDILKEYDLK